MLGHLSLNVIAPADTEPNPVQMEFVRHSVEIYKNFIRPFLPEAQVYHHTPDTNQIRESGYCAYEIAAPDKGKGAMAVYTLTCAKAAQHTVIPKGIDAGKTYKVMLDNSGAAFEISGYELLSRGIPVQIPASMASELVLWEAVE